MADFLESVGRTQALPNALGTILTDIRQQRALDIREKEAAINERVQEQALEVGGVELKRARLELETTERATEQGKKIHQEMMRQVDPRQQTSYLDAGSREREIYDGWLNDAGISKLMKEGGLPTKSELKRTHDAGQSTTEGLRKLVAARRMDDQEQLDDISAKIRSADGDGEKQKALQEKRLAVQIRMANRRAKEPRMIQRVKVWEKKTPEEKKWIGTQISNNPLAIKQNVWEALGQNRTSEQLSELVGHPALSFAKWQEQQAEFERASKVQATGTTSPELRLINEINDLPVGDPNRAVLQKALEKKISASGQVIDIDPASGRISIGPASVIGQRQKAKNQQELSDSETSVRNVIDLADTVSGLAGKDSTAIGIIGGIQRFVDTSVEQIRAASRVATRGLATVDGKEVSESRLFDIDQYNFGPFAKDAARSARLKTTALSLAYIIARQQDPSGRLSDRDVQNALDQIGITSGSVGQLQGALSQVKKNAIATFSNKYRQFMGESLPKDFFGDETVDTSGLDPEVQSLISDTLKSLEQ